MIAASSREVRASWRVWMSVAIPKCSRARVKRHHDLLERRVPRSLADAVDRALHLSRARAHAGERVGDSETEVVVAVRG